MSAVLKLLRFHQWLKNGFIFLPLFFVGRMGDIHAALDTFVAALAFSLVASAVYAINDVMDREEDRCHPEKRKRPVASGTVSVRTTLLLAGLLAMGSGLILVVSELWYAGAWICLYLAINLVYVFLARHIGLVDVFLIATGFVLRLAVGGAATGTSLSAWIVIMTFLLALFLAFAKRRDDLVQLAGGQEGARRSIMEYGTGFVDAALCMLGAVIVVAWIMYSLSVDVMHRFHSQHVYLTTVFVLFGILRYLLLALSGRLTGSPTLAVVKDIPLLVTVALWLAVLAWMLYGGPI